MKRMHFFLFFLLLLFTVNLTATSDRLNWFKFSYFKKPSDIFQIIKERVDSGKSYGMVVGVIDKGEITFYKYGTFGVGNDNPIDENTVFEVGSLTKIFTASIIQDMHDNKELSLEDPAEIFFPEIKFPSYKGQKILVCHLLSHTSGLPYLPYNYSCKNVSNPFADYSIEQAFDFLNSYELPIAPGYVYDYSNLSVGLAGHIISAGDIKNYQKELQNRICKPLGLENTSLGPTENMQKKLTNAHIGDNIVPFWEFPVFFGTGGIYTTAKDLITFLAAHMGVSNTPLTKTFQKTHKVYNYADKYKLKIGLGWHISERYSNRIIYCNGGTGGCRSFMGFCPETQKGLIILSNSAVNINDADVGLGSYLLDSRYDMLPDDEPIVLDPFILDKYIGKYQHPSGLIFTIAKKDRDLTVHLTGYPTAKIFPETQTRFFLKAVSATIDFDFDDQNNVKGLYFTYSGAIHPARKFE